MRQTAPDSDVYDAIIIGSGAGGGPLAYTLSRHGLRVIVLEKGRRYSRSDYAHDELLLNNELSLFAPHLSEDPHVLQRDTGAAQVTSLGWIASCVGGGTSHMGGSLFRLHPDDFRMGSRFGGYDLPDWPYTYDDLEPYYGVAEWAVGVSGKAGSNAFEGRRSRPYPMPPHEEHPLASVLDEAAGQLRLRPFPTPRAINSVPYQGRPACGYCTLCAGFGCPTGARGSSQETVLALAEQTGRCTIRPQCMVREINVGPNNYADGCVYIDQHGNEHRIRGRVVCVCCSAVESARLLLLSRSKRFPDGLANGSGLVGKNLHFQCFSGATGWFPRSPRGFAAPSSHLFLGRSIMDYYHQPSGVSETSKRGLLRFDTARNGPIAKAQKAARRARGELLWGEPLKQALYQCGDDGNEVEVEAFHDFFPNDGTFMDLDPDVRDKWGLPAARIRVSEPAHHQNAGRWLLDRAREVLELMGAQEVADVSVGSINGNLIHGTCRFGTNPRNSVLNEFCQAHEVPNLFVVDGSFMPTSGAVPSTLTILANSFRVGDFIIEEGRKCAFPS